MIILEEVSYDDKVLADWSKVPRYLYTCTLEKYLDDIQKYGLGESSRKNMMGGSYHSDLYDGDGFFLAVDPEEAMMYMSNEEDTVLLRIPKSALDKNYLYYDLNNENLFDHLNGYDDDYFENETTYFYGKVLSNPQKVCTIVD